jgi:hypothetical protein
VSVEVLRAPPGAVKNAFSVLENVFFCLSRTLEYVQCLGAVSYLRLAVPCAARVFDDIVYWDERRSSYCLRIIGK